MKRGRGENHLGSASILLAPSGMLQDGFPVAHNAESIFSLAKPSLQVRGRMPRRASKMLALPKVRQTASFRIRIVLALCCTCFASSALAQSDAEFLKANQDYAQGNFKDAISGYETLVHSRQWSANLFYNLGNAYFRADDFGRAILNYERALALEPHHPEATANLQIARDEARALEMQKSWRERYLQFATTNQYAITAAVAFWLGLFCVAGLIFARRRSAAIIALLAFSILVFAVTVFAIYELDYGSKGRALAIVTGKDVQARLATADTASSVLALPPGSEVKILSTRGDWIYATLPNNLRGWIPAKDAEPVRL